MKCPSCWNEVSALASRCPHCTEEFGTGFLWLVNVLSSLITVALFGLILYWIFG